MTAPAEDADIETASEGYAKRFASPVGVWMLNVQRDITLDLLADAQGSSVLNAGGGHGQVAPALSAKGHQVSVLASTADAVSLSLRPAIDSGRVALLKGDLRNPPGEASFDVVISYRLLAHARDLSRLIAGFTRVAKRSVIVDYATSRSFNAAAARLFAAKKRVEANTRPNGMQLRRSRTASAGEHRLRERASEHGHVDPAQRHHVPGDMDMDTEREYRPHPLHQHQYALRIQVHRHQQRWQKLRARRHPDR